MAKNGSMGPALMESGADVRCGASGPATKVGVGRVASKPRDLGSDRGYRVADIE